MAWNLMHEILHLCGAPPELKAQHGLYWDGFASDHHRCWGIQNTAGNSFLWALSHRYPCLDGTGCSPRVRSAATPGALAFMNPESRADGNYDTPGDPASPNPHWSQNLPFPYRAGVLPC